MVAPSLSRTAAAAQPDRDEAAQQRGRAEQEAGREHGWPGEAKDEEEERHARRALLPTNPAHQRANPALRLSWSRTLASSSPAAATLIAAYARPVGEKGIASKFGGNLVRVLRGVGDARPSAVKPMGLTITRASVTAPGLLVKAVNRTETN